MSVSLTALNDNLISQLALEAFVQKMAPLASFSTSYSADAARRGTVISVPIVANITATTAYPAYETADSGSASAALISLTSYKKASIGITDQQFHGSSFVDVEKFAFQQGKAVAIGVFQDVINNTVGATTSANSFSTVGITGGAANFTIANVRSARATLVKNGAEIDDCSMILNADTFSNLLSDSTNLLSNLAFGGDAIKEGRIPKVLGLETSEVAALPTVNNIMGFIAHPAALALAVRPLVPQDNSYYIESRVVEDEETGLAITYRRHYSPSGGTHWTTFECLYGYTAGLTGGAVTWYSK
jgi:hypothetical protein